MQNAIKTAIYFQQQLPENECPEQTENYEGFFHLTSFKGEIDKTVLTYLIRDHDYRLFEEKKQRLYEIAQNMREKLNTDIQVEITDQYYNMREQIEPHPAIIDIARKAMIACGIQPVVQPIRGGTDGARLSFMGLPCPNLFTGGINFHSRHEFLPVKSLEKSTETVLNIIQITHDRSV